VIDDGEQLARVQCKSGRLRNGAVAFKTSSSYAHHRSSRESRRHYQGQIDFFGVYCRGSKMWSQPVRLPFASTHLETVSGSE
jgi:hypothetical protein